jgi:putative sporulation protein YyaC
MSTFGYRLPQKRDKAYRVDGEDPFAVQKIKWALQNLLQEHYLPREHQLVILCIGTDRSTGDSLGPLIGTKLSRLQPRNTQVFGTLDEPVHAINLAETVAMIEKRYAKPLIVAVDACLGRTESVGSIDIGCGPIRPGAGVNKDLPEVGSIHINGIVNVGGFLEYFVLQNTRLSLVIRLAEAIARGLFFTLQSLPTPVGEGEKKEAVRT